MAGSAHAVGKGIVHVVHLHHGTAILPLRAALNGRAMQVSHQLHAVADAQHRHPQPEDLFVHPGRIRIQHAGRAAGEDYALRLQRAHFLRRRRIGQHQRIYVQFSYPSGDQLGILAAKIQNDHALRFFRHVCFTPLVILSGYKNYSAKPAEGQGLFFSGFRKRRFCRREHWFFPFGRISALFFRGELCYNDNGSPDASPAGNAFGDCPFFILFSFSFIS